MITTPLRILLVEDNEADIIVTKRALTRIVSSPQIEVVADMDSCREKMVNFIPDVVISDYNLPTCTGLEVLQMVQEEDSNVPFIFLTGTVHDEELAANTILAGAWGFILKKHMGNLEEKLRPLLNKVVFHQGSQSPLRERLRKTRIAVNEIYTYLDNLKTDNQEQQENIGKIKDTINRFNLEEEDDDRKT